MKNDVVQRKKQMMDERNGSFRELKKVVFKNEQKKTIKNCSIELGNVIDLLMKNEFSNKI